MKYGLLGGKLSHSYSPLIHGMLADYGYELYPCSPEELDDLLRARDFRGMNVTIPYKKNAYAHCDTLSEEARLLGNVNTLLVDERGLLHGHNTDLYGLLSMIEASGILVRGKKAAVFGSGGSAQTARAALGRLEARQILTVSRQGPLTYARLHKEHTDCEIFVNATPVGMYPHNGESPADLSVFPRLTGVLDLIYNPYRTALLLDARKRGIPAINGLWMLIAQAHRAAELFTGKEIPQIRIHEIHAHIRKQTENVVLVGMPGSGKSKVGEAAARKMGRAFIDLDAELERRAGMRIADIFAHQGEDFFRNLESDLIGEYGKEKALVIATGGGAVLRERNLRALAQNGEIIHLTRPLELLETDGRPLSASKDALRAMYETRLPLYRKYAAKTVDNAASIEEASANVVEGFYEAARH